MRALGVGCWYINISDRALMNLFRKQVKVRVIGEELVEKL